MRSRSDESWTARPATRDDVDGVVRMSNARSQKLYGANQATRDVTLEWWNGLRFDLTRDTRVVLDENGRVIAWAHVWNPGEPYVSIGCGVTIHPEVEGVDGLWDRLYAWGTRRANDFVPLAPPDARVFIRENANAIDEARRKAVERAGFGFVRIENTMRIDFTSPPPTPVWPDGIHVRAADIATDLREIVVASEEAFRDRGDAFDPSLWFLACEGSRIVGMALCSDRVADDRSRAYVESLSVRPAWRKRGIALALLHHAFGELQRRGYQGAHLEVDSESLTGTLALYTKAGMHSIRRSYAYEKELRPGIDLATREAA